MPCWVEEKAISSNLPTLRSKAAYAWLLVNNKTCARYISRHNEILASEEKNRFYITTANLLLHEHGIEVAMRPCLYPREAFGDSDVTERLLRLGRMTDMQKSSIRTSFLRKCQSRCLKYARDYMLCFLMYDIAMARAYHYRQVREEKELGSGSCMWFIHVFGDLLAAWDRYYSRSHPPVWKTVSWSFRHETLCTCTSW